MDAIGADIWIIKGSQGNCKEKIPPAQFGYGSIIFLYLICLSDGIARCKKGNGCAVSDDGMDLLQILRDILRMDTEF